MAPVTCNPMKLPGPWVEGYALERQHTLSSQFLGTDSSGRDHFDTVYSELGKLIFRLKNRNDTGVLGVIAETAEVFIMGWAVPFDLIVPIPPSRKRTSYQPVVEIAAAISARVSKRVVPGVVRKVKATPELKNVFDYQQRIELLQDAFAVDTDAVQGRRVLLIDDLYRSGATATVVAQALQRAGAAAVYLLAITKTRTRT